MTVEPEGISFDVELSTSTVSLAAQAPDNPVALYPVPGAPGPRGLPGTGVQIVGEIPFGTKDGGNTVFTTEHAYTPGSTALFRNGLRGLRGFDYDEWPPNRIAMADAPAPDHMLEIDYTIA